MRALCTAAGDMSHSPAMSELGSSEEITQAGALQGRMWEKQKDAEQALGIVTLFSFCHGQKRYMMNMAMAPGRSSNRDSSATSGQALHLVVCGALLPKRKACPMVAHYALLLRTHSKHKTRPSSFRSPGAVCFRHAYLAEAIEHLLASSRHHADLLFPHIAQQDVEVLQILLSVAAPVALQALLN